jgi:septal ring factor EnvC (AmiA/AmiB activator)
MVYTLGQAAKATGKSKTAIANALEKGRLSATKDSFGQWQIDPAELYRVYPPKSTISNDLEHQVTPDRTAEIERLKATIEGLERLNRQIEGERDNLRSRLEAADDERQRTLSQLTALLTDQREQPARRGWWPFRKRA